MKILIKLGGTLLDAAESRERLAVQIAALWKAGHQVVTVHGGGKQVTGFLEERGISSRFINGLRVTTAETLDAVVKVLAGTVNKTLVSALMQAAAPAVGICGVDGGLVEAEPESEELGAVGRVARANPELINTLLRGGYLPIVACIGGNRHGEIFNINGDQMAAACAAAFGADRLIFVTDVSGVMNAAGQVEPFLTVPDCEKLILQGVARGGMQAKLNSAINAVRLGVPRVHIVPGTVPAVLGDVLAHIEGAGCSLGTRIIAN